MRRWRAIVGLAVAVSIAVSACGSGSTSTTIIQPDAELLGLPSEEVPGLECLDGQHTAALIGAPPMPDVPGFGSKEQAVDDIARQMGVEGNAVEVGDETWAIESEDFRTVLVTGVVAQDVGWFAASAEYCSDE